MLRRNYSSGSWVGSGERNWEIAKKRTPSFGKKERSDWRPTKDSVHRQKTKGVGSNVWGIIGEGGSSGKKKTEVRRWGGGKRGKRKKHRLVKRIVGRQGTGKGKSGWNKKSDGPAAPFWGWGFLRRGTPQSDKKGPCDLQNGGKGGGLLSLVETSAQGPSAQHQRGGGGGAGVLKNGAEKKDGKTTGDKEGKKGGVGPADIDIDGESDVPIVNRTGCGKTNAGSKKGSGQREKTKDSAKKSVGAEGG